MLENYRVLIVEDEEVTRENLKEALSLMIKDVFIAKDGKEAWDTYLNVKPHIIISDIEMPYLNGLELAQKIRRNDKDTQIIIVSAYTNTEYLLKAVELNLVRYIIKPVTPSSIIDALNMAKENILATDNPVKVISEDCSYNLETRTLLFNGIEQKLTSFQRVFLEYMLKASNRLVDYCELENNIWCEEGMSSDAIRTLVKALRQKLPPDTIVNFSRVGYKLVTL